MHHATKSLSNIYDLAHANAETYGITNAQVSRTNAGTISSVFGSVGSVQLSAGSSWNTINVTAAARTLDSLLPLTIDGGGSSSAVVDDSNNAAATTYILTANGLTRLAAGQSAVTITYAHLGGLTLNTGSGAENVIVDDSSNPGATTYNIKATSLLSNAASGASFAINYAQVQRLYLITGSGADTSMWRAAPTTIHGGGGADTFNVAPLSLSLDGITSALRLDGGRGGAALNFYDQANPSGYGSFAPSTEYIITGSNLTRTVFFPLTSTKSATTIKSAHLKSLTLNAGNNGPNIVNVDSTSVPTFINGGTATSQINITPTSQNLDNLKADMRIYAPSSALTVYDQANPHGAAPGTPTTYGVSWVIQRKAEGTRLVT